MNPQLPESPTPYVPPPPAGPVIQLTPLTWRDPLRWLEQGWADLIRFPAIGAFYGVSFWLMAVLIGLVFRHRPEYVMSMASGCLLLGPFMAMGLYDVSRRREAGERPSLGYSLTCWDAHLRSMALLLLLLLVLELLWGRASLVVFAVFFDTGMPSTAGVLEAVFSPDNWTFVAVYAAVGGVFAALVFTLSVVSIPMILDRDTDAITAGITSFRVVFGHPGVMLLWGFIITALVALAVWPLGAGLVVVGPLLGHASWHAYRGCVRWPDQAASGAHSQPSGAVLQ